MTITNGIEIKKIKSPKISPNKRNNKSYGKFLKEGAKSSKPTETKDKKIIKVQRKRNSPQRSSKNIQDINDIERNMLMMKKNNIKVPTQNTGITTNNKLSDQIVNKPVVNKPSVNKPSVNKPSVNKPSVNKPLVNKPSVNKPVVNKPVVNKPKKSSMKSRITRSPKRVRISDIDVRESRTEDKTEVIPEKVQPERVQPNKVQPKKVQPKKLQPKKVAQKVQPKKVKRDTQRSKKRSKNRTISIKNRKLNKINVNEVSKKMRNIRNTNKEEIKKELEKQGVKVSGKSDRLLKDIYLYSKVCNINITHEV